jgi:hypothetical protein
MITPTYETAADRARENAIADTLAAAWRCEVVRQPQYAPVDFHIIEEAAVVGLAELKGRHNLRAKYPTVWFAVAKRDALLVEAARRGLPPDCCLFVVAWDFDAIAWVTVPACADLVPVMGKRNSRPDTTAEPVLPVPTERFTVVIERE